MEIKLNGVSAAVGAFVAIGFVLFRSASMQTELETQALDELRSYLVAEYTGAQAAPLSEALASGAPIDQEQARLQAQSVLDASNVELVSVTGRGFRDARDGGNAVVKVEIRVNGGPPPDGVSTRYYRMRYRSLAGWRVGARTSVWSYRLKMF